jgi:predicted  nucleic acid-binding Zn-ribbon protein
MADDKSWMSIAVTVVALGVGALWAVSQNQFANTDKTISDLGRRLAIVEATQATLITKLAHDPVEDKTFQAVAKATDDRIVLLQNQITDINRQIAAALIIIDQNAGMKRNAAPLPP